MKKREFKKLLAASLAAAICVTGINFSPLLQAREAEAAEAAEEEQLEETKVELSEERTEDTTTYQLADGTKELVFYSEDVRFENEKGELVDYDATLTEISGKKSEQDNSLEGYAYENTEGDKKNYIPETLDAETPLLLENDGKSIEIAPAVEEPDNAFAGTEAFEKADKIVEKVEDIYDEESKETTGTSYVTKDETLELQYFSGNNGVKENIILNEKPKSNVFQYIMDFEGLIPSVNELTGNVDLYEKDAKEPSAYIEAPFMDDASGENHSEEAYYEIEETKDGKYLLTLTVDAEYLEYAQYPVTIDPTTTWRSDPKLMDAYVIKGSTYGDINFHDGGITAMSVGKATQGLSRTYMKMDALTATIKGFNVVSAKLYLYENGSYATSNNIQIRRVTESWVLDKVTWNNQPTYGGTIDTVKTNGTSGHEMVADITSHLRKIANGGYSNQGVLLRNEDESGSKYTKLYGTRHSTTSKTPKMVVKYVDGPATATSVSASPNYVKKGGAVTLSWSGINSSYLSYIQYRVANSSGTNVVEYSSSTKIGTAAAGSKTVNTGSWADGTYRYYIRGVDTGGIKGTAKGVNVVVDNTVPVIKTLETAPSSTSTKKIKPQNVAVKWTAAETNLASVKYNVNGGEFKVATNALSGNITIPASVFTASGTYKIGIQVKDKANNAVTQYTNVYVDKDAPVIQSASLSPQTSEDKPSKNTAPVINWTVKACGDVAKVEYSLNGTTYYSMGNTESGNYQLPVSSVVTPGQHYVYVRATDKTGNVGSPIKATYWLDDISINMDDYAITDLSLAESYGKNIIRWAAKTALPDKMDVRIYRSKIKGFAPAASDIVYEGHGTSYWADMETSGETYYYRVSVLRRNAKGTVVEEKLSATEVSGTGQTVKASVDGRTGSMFWGSYFSYDTPTGNGSVEKSSGNHMYSQEDFALTNSQLSYGLSRTYNSSLNMTGMLGAGWTDSWHMELYKSGDKILLLQQDGSVYTFTSGGNAAEYSCVEDSTYELRLSDNTYILTDADNRRYTFNICGQLEQTEEPNGNTVTNIYDASGRISSVVSNQGKASQKSLELNYQDAKSCLLSEIILPDDTAMTYSYENGCLVSVKHFDKSRAQCVNYQYGYQEDARMNTIKDAEGNAYKLAYSSGKVNKLTYPNGEYVIFDYTGGVTSVSEYDVQNRKISTDRTVLDAAVGKILSITDTVGNKTDYRYAYTVNSLLYTGTETQKEYEEIENGKVVIKEKTVTTKVNYNSKEEVTRETDESGNVTDYTYDENGNVLTEKTNADSGEIISNNEYSYDENDNLLSEQNHIEDVATSYQYDADGNAISESEVTEDTLDSYTGDYGYDENGNEISSAVENGTVQIETTSEHDAMGRLTKEVSDTGAVTTYDYDFMGRCIRTTIIYPDGSRDVSTSSYNANGTLVAETDKNGVTRTYTFDSLNRVTQKKVQKDTAAVYTTAYGTKADVQIRDGKSGYICPVVYVQSEYENGELVSEIYTDGNGHQVRTVEDGIYTDYTYDKSGNAIAVIKYGGETTGQLSVNVYDADGNHTAVIENAGVSDTDYLANDESAVTHMVYDASGNLIKSTDARNVSTLYAYDESGKLTGITENNGSADAVTSTIQYQTTEEGLVTTSIDGNGNKGIEVKDAAGLLLRAEDIGTDGTGIVTRYEYDKEGNKTKRSNADGSFISYTYDGKGQLIRTEAYDKEQKLSSVTTYVYDSKGNVVQLTDSQVSDTGTVVPYLYTCYTYDAHGRLSAYGEFQQEGEPETAVKDAGMIRYTYDAADKLTKITYPSKGSKVEALTYQYNPGGTRLEGIQAVIGGQKKALREYAYDSLGRVSKIRTYLDFDGAGNTFTDADYTYDTFDRVTAMVYRDKNGTEKESYRYAYDKNSNITSREEKNLYASDVKGQIHKKKLYQYDAFGQLVSSQENDYNSSEQAVVTYAYDKAGNRIREEENGTVTEYTYNGLDQLLSYQTVKDGKAEADITYTYDANGNQISETDAVSSTVWKNIYDSMNQLTEQKVYTDNQEVLSQKNWYNGEGQRISKEENGILTRYYYDGNSLVYTEKSSGSLETMNLNVPSGSAITTSRFADDNEQFYMYHKDVAGSTTTLTNAENQSVGIYSYSDFGETSEVQEVSIPNEICYTGAVYDESTGLYYLNARYYEPEIGRFITQDTYRGESNEPNTWHLYAYCANDPINYVDPSGHAAMALSGGYYAVAVSAAVIGAMVSIGPAGWITITAIVGTVMISNILYKKVKATKKVKVNQKAVKGRSRQSNNNKSKQPKGAHNNLKNGKKSKNKHEKADTRRQNEQNKKYRENWKDNSNKRR